MRGGEWKLITLPFEFDLANIIVDGNAPIYGTNVAIQTYNAARRAQSYEGWTISGWEYKTEGSIPASQGFAITIDAEIGESKDVVFKLLEKRTYTNDDNEVTLSLNPTDVNDGMDANWNIIGTPLLDSSTKGEGYSLYIYDAKDNAYTEYASVESASITPHGAMFIQGADDFESMTFSAGLEVSKSASLIDGKITLTINGDEDEAKMFILYGASDEFVVNEDAIYFAPLSSKVSQIYYVDQNGKSLASSVVPSIAESTKVTYSAISSGTQSIAMTTNITDTALYLEDAVTGTSTLMVDGAIYEFESEAGTFSNRFTLVTESEVTGIESVASSSVKVVTSNNTITVIDAEIGSPIAIYSANGTQLYNGVVSLPKEVISLSATGVIIIKVGTNSIKAIL